MILDILGLFAFFFLYGLTEQLDVHIVAYILHMAVLFGAEDIARARACGMNGHIAKPIDVTLLMQTLRQAF